MRAMSVLRSYKALAMLLAVAGIVSLLSVPEAPRWMAPLGVLPGLLYYLIVSRREWLRLEVLRRPFPLEWREVLVRRVPLYRQLSPQESQRFEQEIQIFLAEQRIYPLQGAELWRHFPGGVTDEHRLLIAASAATLTLGRPDWRLPTVRDIVVYPMPFTEETYEATEFGHTQGMVHAQGPILLSLPAVLRSYPAQAGEMDLSEPAPNVGIHEFAHVLDFLGSDGRASGVPSLLSRQERGRWERQLQAERERLEAGNSILHPYGLKNDAELFAVAVESFFGDPLRMRTLHPALYELMRDFFSQDPAARVLPMHSHWLLRPWFAAPMRYVA